MVLIEGEYKKNDDLRGEVDTLTMERDFYRRKSDIHEREMREREQAIKKERNRKTWTGIATGLAGVGAAVGGYYIGRNTK